MKNRSVRSKPVQIKVYIRLFILRKYLYWNYIAGNSYFGEKMQKLVFHLMMVILPLIKGIIPWKFKKKKIKKVLFRVIMLVGVLSCMSLVSWLSRCWAGYISSNICFVAFSYIIYRHFIWLVCVLRTLSLILFLIFSLLFNGTECGAAWEKLRKNYFRLISSRTSLI